MLLLVLLSPPLIAALLFYCAMRNLSPRRSWLVWVGFALLTTALTIGAIRIGLDEDIGGYGPEFAVAVYFIYVAGPLIGGAGLGILLGYLVRRRKMRKL